MKFQPLLPIAAALAVVAFVLAFSSPATRTAQLPAAPAGLLPIGGFESASSSPLYGTPVLGGLHVNTTGNPFFDRFLNPQADEIAEGTEASTTAIEGTTSPAAAAAVASKKEEPKAAAPTEAELARSALTANTLALRNAIVNIICVPKDGLKSISGTGVIIDSRGIILTVAHVAQMYLLADYPTKGNVTCVVRSGSPAKTAYRAELVYISSDWVKDNPDTLVAKAPKGTGEYDFALLAIRESLTADPLPVVFPAVPLTMKTSQVGDKVGIGTYGAQYLSSAQVKSELYPIIVFGSVNNRYTFGTNTVDVLSVNGGAAAQQGSSGGSVVNAAGELVGLITTSMISGDFATRDTRAITPRHMREAFKEDTGTDLEAYLQGDFNTLVANFISDAKKLRGVLVNAID